jgi:hypothetical protein
MLARAVDGILETLPAAVDPAPRQALAEALRHGVTDLSQLEASVRIGPDGRARAGRVMIEAAPLAVVRATCHALGVTLSAPAERLAEATAAEGLTLIAGWDVGAVHPRAKLYANASDAGPGVRRRLAQACGVGALPAPLDAPHVIGLNLAPGSSETKLYVQGVAPPPESAAAGRLDASAAALGASAGTIVSWDLSDPPTPRAFFVATRRDAAPGIARLLASLPGWSPEVLELLPFPPGTARSVGVSLRGPDELTVYFKPAGAAPPVALLDPTLRCRAGSVEVGIFVEPGREAPRAYLRTARHAVSYRPSEGEPDPALLRVLMTWVGARVRAAELSGRPPSALLVAPPPPWRLVT